jgi:hypothetical protein
MKDGQGQRQRTLNFMRFMVFKSCFCMCTLPMLWPMPLDSLFFCFPPMISLFCFGTWGVVNWHVMRLAMAE